MARDRNTFEKRQRETRKKQKAEAKRARRVKKKSAIDGAEGGNGQSDIDHQQ